jgi:hypothetical protein
MHLYMTLKLLALIYLVKVAGWNHPLSLITTKCDPQGVTIDHSASQSYTKNHLNPIPYPNHSHIKIIPSNLGRISTACNRKLDYYDSCTLWKD